MGEKRKLATVFWDLEQTDLVENVCKLLQTKSSSSSSDDSEGDPSAAKMNLPKYKKEQVCVVVVDGEDMGADAKATQERTLDSYAEYLREGIVQSSLHSSLSSGPLHPLVRSLIWPLLDIKPSSVVQLMRSLFA